jgi:hypothetical protein
MIIVNEFTTPHERIVWGASDTETHTYIDGIRVSSEDLLNLGRTHNIAWFRDHAEVRTYAWLFSDGKRFFYTDDFNEYVEFCADHMISTIWWYNAKFDFSQIDFQILTNDRWMRRETSDSRPTKFRDHEYKSLHGTHGQRYCYKLAIEHVNKARPKHVHTTSHFDLCNIFGGGLDKLLKDLNVVDFDGKPIRKLDMDYQGDGDISYMKNDVHGLYHACRIASELMATLFDGRTLIGSKPSVMTAGGLAKKTLLKYLYGDSDTENVKKFQRDHQISYGCDWYYRTHLLYKGGLTFLNPRYQNKLFTIPMYKYDANSMYPDKMAKMRECFGIPKRLKLNFEEWTSFPRNPDKVYILMIKSWQAVTRENMLGVWNNPVYSKFQSVIEYGDSGEPMMLMFADEFEELSKWYLTIDITLDGVIEYPSRINPHYREFVDTYYKLKNDAKIEKNKLLELFAKIVINSSYGKLAENPNKPESYYILDENVHAVRLQPVGIITDEKCLLSIVNGAQITALARSDLLSNIRKCTDNPARDLVYTDTDSIAILSPHPSPDPHTLGAYKDETDGAPLNFSKYILPKTYICGHCDREKILDMTVHTKGVNVKNVESILKDHNGNWFPLSKIDQIFKSGTQVQCLSAINIRGGKALIPTMKYIAREDNFIDEN